MLEWMSSFTKWCLDEETKTASEESKTKKSFEEGATEQFQRLFLKNISLKPEIVEQIARYKCTLLR